MANKCVICNTPIPDENHIFAANQLCKKMDWKGKLVMGGFPKFNVHVFVERKY